LRFKGFQGEWEEKTLGTIAEIIGGGTPDTTIDEYWNGDIQWFTPSEIKSNYVSKSQRTITELGLNKSSAKLLPVGSILITTRATIGEVTIATEACSTNQGFQSLVVNENINNLFISNWIKQNRSELIRRSKGSTFAEISKSEIEQMPIQLPSELPEQNKIAKFLSLLDERIETQIKIIEKYESLIKGIVDLHFRTSKRKTYSIKELGEYFNTMGLSKENLSIDGKECILYGELFTTYGCVINKIKSRTTKNDCKLTVSSNKDLLFPSSTTVDAYSLISPSAILKEGVILGGDMFGIRINENFDNEYLSYMFNYVYKNELAKYAKGSTIVHLHYNEIKNVKIEVPSLEEQRRVAKILGLLQEKIIIEKKLSQIYKKQKEYLLQNLFI
jgi:type I restriction enzyme S subunit